MWYWIFLSKAIWRMIPLSPLSLNSGEFLSKHCTKLRLHNLTSFNFQEWFLRWSGYRDRSSSFLLFGTFEWCFERLFQGIFLCNNNVYNTGYFFPRILNLNFTCLINLPNFLLKLKTSYCNSGTEIQNVNYYTTFSKYLIT